jgi:phosphohistidine phosphatase SixA
MIRMILALAMLAAAAGTAAADEAARALLAEGGKVVLMRHALAPGTGDPANFAVEDCATQRNLSDDGRAQARRIGDRFRDWGVQVDAVLSSRWCRSLDTARLAFGEERVEPFPPLDSFFGYRPAEPAQTAAVRERIAGFDGGGVLVMVTHQVNITALTGIFPRSGEAIILAPAADGFSVAGRLAID